MAFVSPAQGVLVGGPGGGVTEVGMFTRDSGKRWLGLPTLTAEPQKLGASLTVTQAAWLSPRTVMVVNGYWTERRYKNWPILEVMTLSLSHRTWHRIRLPVQGLEGTALGPSDPTAAAVVARERGYFASHADRMDDPRYRRLGLPIGLGTVESACKVVWKQRLSQGGMRWRRAGAQAVATLRAWSRSGRWTELWASDPLRQQVPLRRRCTA
ncbi:MAG: hypothetical protein OWU84_02195 [Firmicutes bacterium]|nr:hypothetical protein [Bacillota bacterium]